MLPVPAPCRTRAQLMPISTCSPCSAWPCQRQKTPAIQVSRPLLNRLGTLASAPAECPGPCQVPMSRGAKGRRERGRTDRLLRAPRRLPFHCMPLHFRLFPKSAFCCPPPPVTCHVPSSCISCPPFLGAPEASCCFQRESWPELGHCPTSRPLMSWLGSLRRSGPCGGASPAWLPALPQAQQPAQLLPTRPSWPRPAWTSSFRTSSLGTELPPLQTPATSSGRGWGGHLANTV